MRVIVVCQNKGGDGKTTVSRLLGEWAGRHGLRTLMIDMDPQCNLSQRFLTMDYNASDPDGGVMPPVHPEYNPGEDWDGRCSIADVYNGRIARYGLSPYPTEVPNVDILPGHGSEMRKAELQRAEDVKAKIIERLREFIDDPLFASLYDLVVIDTPPSKGPLVQSAIRAATHMLIPSQMEQGSVEGLQGMFSLWKRENRDRRADRQIVMLGILPSKFRNIAVQTGTLEGLKTRTTIAHYLIPLMLNLRAAFAEADHPLAKPKSIFDLHAPNKAREEAEAVCRFIFERLQLEGSPGAAPAVAA